MGRRTFLYRDFDALAVQRFGHALHAAHERGDVARAALRADEGTGHGALARFMVADILPETRGLNRKVKATGRALESIEAALA